MPNKYYGLQVKGTDCYGSPDKKQIALRLPKKLFRQLNSAAKYENVSVNGFVSQIISGYFDAFPNEGAI